MTLNCRYALYCRKGASFGTHHKYFNEGRPIRPIRPTPSAAKMLHSDPTFWRNKVYADIRGFRWWEDIKRQRGCRQRQFSAILLAISWKTLEIKPALLYSDMQSVVGFMAIPKCVTFNDPWMSISRWILFSRRLINCLASDLATFEDSCVKTNKDRHILSASQIVCSHSTDSGSIR